MRCLDTGPNCRTQQYQAIFAIRPSIRRCGARRNGAHGWAQNWAQRRKFSSTRENPEATNAMIQKKKYGGRDRDRTGDPLLAKNRSPLQRLRPLFWFPMFSTIWGICFLLNTNSNVMKTYDSCTLRAQSPDHYRQTFLALSVAGVSLPPPSSRRRPVAESLALRDRARRESPPPTSGPTRLARQNSAEYSRSPLSQVHSPHA